MTLKLASAHIKNFKSLADVTLNFRDLTIIVGANSTGKSNCLESLSFLSALLNASTPPPTDLMRRILTIDASEDMRLKAMIEDNQKKADYAVSLSVSSQKAFFSKEELLIGDTQVINVKKGKGKVCDENGQNSQEYQSKDGKLALNSAGDFGNKPFTAKIAEFIKNWEFYDLDPDLMRRIGERIIFPGRVIIHSQKTDTIPTLDNSGSELRDILVYWANKDKQKFQDINQSLSECLGINLTLKTDSKDEDELILVQEQDSIEIPLSSMSDGTLRLIAYHSLLYHDELPPLIGIEEPERNLHPKILLDVASILKRLSKRTQVIITTHSSQLLDCFSLDEISSDISVLLLTKKGACQTQCFSLEQLGKERTDLEEWMAEFGVGSAVYHSNLLQEVEKQYA